MRKHTSSSTFNDCMQAHMAAAAAATAGIEACGMLCDVGAASNIKLMPLTGGAASTALVLLLTLLGCAPGPLQERQDRQLCELAAGLSALSAARQAERRHWAAQLEALEGGLEGARAEVEQHRWGAATTTCYPHLNHLNVAAS
jgi:hypothetical protein